MTISQLTLKLVLPLATTWAEQQEQLTLREGVPLTPQLLDDARRVGVAHPERVRLRQVDRVPMPVHPLLRTVGEKTGLISPHVAAMSLRYGLNIRSTEWGNRRIIVHELAHTAQYERLGGVREFLAQYLQECLQFGYDHSPLELEARAAEALARD